MPNVTVHRGFHQTPESYYAYSEQALNRALETNKITIDDASLLREFIGEISVNLSPQRTFKEYYILINWRNFINPFRENKAADLFTGIEMLRLARRSNGKPYAKNTIGDYIRFLKRFYLWMNENEYTDITEKRRSRN